MVCWVVESCFGEHCEVAGKYLGSRSESIDDDGWKIDLDLARSYEWANHPHSLSLDVRIA